MPQKQHVAIKLTEGGGPEPLMELQRIYEAARTGAQGASWIATRKPGVAFVQDAESRMLAFARAPMAQDSVCVLHARIDRRSGEAPDDPVAKDLYGERAHDFHAFWRITDVGLAWMPWEELPGETIHGTPLPRAFKGSASFVYWHPPSTELMRSVWAPYEERASIETGPLLQGESLVALSEREIPPAPFHMAKGAVEDYMSVDQVAQFLGIAKSTVMRRLQEDQMVGFRSIGDALRIPKEQFVNGTVVGGVPEVLRMFAEESLEGEVETNHRGAWNFLITSLYPGDSAPRPIDQLKMVSPGHTQIDVVAELALAKESLDYGDHL